MPAKRPKPKFKLIGKGPNKAAIQAFAQMAWNVAGRELAEKRKNKGAK